MLVFFYDVDWLWIKSIFETKIRVNASSRLWGMYIELHHFKFMQANPEKLNVYIKRFID